MYTIDFTGKVALVMGVANERSIAAAIARLLAQTGCRLVVTYQNERIQQNHVRLFEEWQQLGAEVISWPCDVADPEQINALFAEIEKQEGQLDFFVHSLAYAPKEAMENPYSETTWEAYSQALEVSAYSFIGLVKRFASLTRDGGSVVTLTFGGGRVYPGYNVMGTAKAALEDSVRQLAVELGPKGIRVNAVSSGPLNTLAARGIPGFTGMRQHHQQAAPLSQSVTQEAIAKVVLSLLSDLSSPTTGHIQMADGGYSLLGV